MSSSVTRSEEETAAAGARLARELFAGPRPAVVSLKGELGAGKTAFARGFIAEWLRLGGESSSEPVTSPSFNVARVYGTRSPVAHLDLYRLSRAAELEQLGLEHYVHEVGCCLVEWLEQVPEASALLPAGALEIELVFGESPTMRTLKRKKLKRTS